MSALPKCKAKKCPLDKETCRRYTEEANPMRQQWLIPRIDRKGKCTEFINNYKTKK